MGQDQERKQTWTGDVVERGDGEVIANRLYKRFETKPVELYTAKDHTGVNPINSRKQLVDRITELYEDNGGD